MEKRLAVAITGGIGSGKSTFAQFLEAKGFPVIQADPLAQELYTTNSELKENLMKEFGSEVYPNGIFEKQALVKKAFVNKASIDKLNGIVHPVVIKEIRKKISWMKNSNIVFVEAALIFEAKMENIFQYIVLITANEETRIERAVKKGLGTPTEIRKRMQFQLPEEEKKAKADFTFFNDGTLQDLEAKAELLVNILLTQQKS